MPSPGVRLLVSLWATLVSPLPAAAPLSGFGDAAVVLATVDADVFAWSPDGERLAFVDAGGIRVATAPDFANPVLLVRKPRGSGGSFPVPDLLWSPDGTRLAFADARPGDGWTTIWVVNADGTGLRELLPPGSPFGVPGIRALRLERWLDEGHIAFTQRCGTGCLALHTVAVDATRFELMCVAGEVTYVWHPGQQRVFAASLNAPVWSSLAMADRTLEPAAPSADGLVSLACPVLLEGACAADGSGGELHTLIGWSAGADHAVLGVRRCGPVVDDLPTLAAEMAAVRLELRTGRRKTLAEAAAALAMAGDGTQLAVLQADASGASSGSVRLTVLDAETGARRWAVSVPPPEISPPDTWRLFWSPDGRQLAVSDGRRLVALVGDGVLRTLPPEVGSADVFPDPWSPDGRWLALRDAAGDLTLLRAGDLYLARLTRGWEAEPRWSPRGDTLVLWPLARRAASVSDPVGLERFLPPVARVDFGTSDEALIQRYFEGALALATESHRFFAMEYDAALDALAAEKNSRGRPLPPAPQTASPAELPPAYLVHVR